MNKIKNTSDKIIIFNYIMVKHDGGIPFTDHGAQIPPPPHIFDFSFFFI